MIVLEGAGNAASRMVSEGFQVKMLRKSVVLAALLATSMFTPAGAETISGALAKAYQYNSELNAARAGVRVTDEGVAIAKSGYRPNIAGSASIDFSTTRSRTAFGNSTTNLTTGGFGVQIQQTLFDFAAQQSLRNTEQNILFNAAAAYMDVIRDRQIAALRERNLQFLGEQVRAARSRFDVGEGTRTDVAQAEASRSAAVAQLSAARAQALSSEAVYRQIIGDAPNGLKTPGAAKGLPKSFDQAVAAAAAQHPAILATTHLVDAAAFAVKSTQGALLPQLSASAGISQAYRNSNPDAISDGNSTSASIGATLTVPIYQGGRVSAQVRQSKESLGQARIQVDVSRDQVRAAVASAWTMYQAAREAVAANRELVSAAQLALNGVVEERNVGQRTTLDVLNAQADVTAAQINLVSSERDVVVASYAILSSTGQLTVSRLGLAVAEYKPDEHYEAVKDKWYGLRTPDGR